MSLVMFKKTTLTGGGATAVDGINVTALVGGEVCWATVSDVKYTYQMNASSGASADGINIIIPVVGTVGDKRWILQGVYATTATLTTAIADNTSTTRAATTAYAKSQDAVLANPKAMSQAVAMTAAASESSGITVADNDNIDFGTGDLTPVWKGSLPDWTPIADQWMVYKYAGGVGYALGTAHTTGKPQIYINAALYTASIATSFADGTTHEIACVVTVGAANTTVDFFADGIVLGVQQTAANPGTVSNAASLSVLGANDLRIAGTVHHAYTFNRALSAAEVLDLYRNGIAEADKWGSQTSLNVATLVNVAALQYTDFSGASSTDFHAESDGSGSDMASTTDSVSFTSGKKYRISFFCAKISGTFPFFAAAIGQNDTLLSGTAQQTAVEGINNYEFAAGETVTGVVGWYNISTATHYTISNFSIVEIGATLALEPEGIQPVPGQWLDSSTNKLHAIYPVAGAALTRRMKTFEIRGTNTWAGTHEAQSINSLTDDSRAILPPNCYVTDIIGVITGVTVHDIIVGDGSDTDHWVAITTDLAAGTVAFTVANRISDGTNYEMVIDPDTNATMVINWTIRGIIL